MQSVLLISIILLSGCYTTPPPAPIPSKAPPIIAQEERLEAVPQQIIVKYKSQPSLQTSSITPLFKLEGTKVVDSFDAGAPVQLHHLPADIPIETAIQMYETNPTVEYAEANYKVKLADVAPPNDPLLA